MNRSLALALLASVSLAAADRIVLTNGDTITGTIVKKDGAKLTVKSEFLGEVSMPWSAVKSISSDTEVFVQLPGGETVKGKLATQDNQLQVAAPGGQKTAPLAQIAAVRNEGEQKAWERLQHPNLAELWAGNFDIGLALARGNARTDTLTTGFNAARVTKNDKIAFSFSQIYGTARVNDVTSTIASAVRGGWRYNRNVSPRFFVSLMNDYEHDSFQNLNLRFVGGAGAGYKAVKRAKLSLDFDAGGDYDRENYFNSLNRNFGEINFGDALAYKVSAATSVTQSFRLFNNLSETGQYRINFDLGAVTVLRKWLGWHVTASDRFLSNPVEGRQRNDLLLSTGFRLTFAR